MMNRKSWLLHIFTAISLAVFFGIGLAACASLGAGCVKSKRVLLIKIELGEYIMLFFMIYVIYAKYLAGSVFLCHVFYKFSASDNFYNPF